MKARLMKLCACLFIALIAAGSGAGPQASAADTTATGAVERPAAPQELQKFCETAACRHDLRVRLRLDKGKLFDETFKLLPPAVQDGMITIHAGEKVSAVPVFEGDRFTGWRAVRPDEATQTQIVSVDLSQSDESTAMMAHVSTNTGPAIKLQMGLIRIDGNDRPEATSSCPLRAGGFSAYEMWPYPIFVLIVAGAKRLSDTDTMTCE